MVYLTIETENAPPLLTGLGSGLYDKTGVNPVGVVTTRTYIRVLGPGTLGAGIYLGTHETEWPEVKTFL